MVSYLGTLEALPGRGAPRDAARATEFVMVALYQAAMFVAVVQELLESMLGYDALMGMASPHGMTAHRDATFTGHGAAVWWHVDHGPLSDAADACKPAGGS